MARARKAASDTTTMTAKDKPPLPAGWQWVRFGEVVENVNETVKDPLAAGLERFVGLEHIEPRDLRIRSWGNVADGITFNRVFRAGQVLFGKRRAYQRKAALADFDGICSGDIYVFAADGKRLLPGLLPFLVQTEDFAHYAETTSEGSLSPRTKWKYLAEYQFALPADLKEQQRIALLLKGARSACESWECALDAAEFHRRTVLRDCFDLVSANLWNAGGSRRLPTGWRCVRTDEAGEVRVGQRYAPEHRTGKYTRPYLRVANVFDGWLSLDDIKEMDFDETAYKTLALKPGDILLAEGQSRELVGRSAIYRGEIPGACYQNTLLRFRVAEGLLPEFAHAYFQHLLYSGGFARIARQTTSIAHLRVDKFCALPFLLPPTDVQADLVRTLTAVGEARQTLRQRLDTSRQLAARLAEELFRNERHHGA
jgi:type I restriction enzyme S subunit